MAEKPSIYPTPDKDILLVETTSPLEQHIARAHTVVETGLVDAHAKVQGVVSKWITVEEKVEARVKSLVPSKTIEPLTPGLLYVGIATLSASIIARTRGRTLRVVLPSIAFFGSLNYFLPVTSSNIGRYTRELESNYLPTVAVHHNAVENRISTTIDQTHATLRGSQKTVYANAQHQISTGLGKVASELEKQTGWKVAEVFRGSK